MLRFLTDSHVPPAISQAARKLGSLEITPLREWHGGIYLHEHDPKLLAWHERTQRFVPNSPSQIRLS